jgi:cytochrome c peroxidase
MAMQLLTHSKKKANGKIYTYYSIAQPYWEDKKNKKKILFIGGNFWDGRATGEKLGNPAADQAQGPFLNPAEQALRDSACVAYKVATSDYYIIYKKVWGTIDIDWSSYKMDKMCAKEGDMIKLCQNLKSPRISILLSWVILV